MKTITVSAKARALSALLKSARVGTVVLQSADGQRFALTPIDDWESFDVGGGRDFAAEVKRTARNKRLMKSLAERKSGAKTKGIPLAEVRKRLGLRPLNPE